MIAGITASQKIENIVYATEWFYIGTSGASNETVNAGIILDRYGNPVTSCSTSTTIKAWLTANYPPSNYAVEHRIRVTHGYSGGPCTAYIYEAQ